MNGRFFVNGESDRSWPIESGYKKSATLIDTRNRKVLPEKAPVYTAPISLKGILGGHEEYVEEQYGFSSVNILLSYYPEFLSDDPRMIFEMLPLIGVDGKDGDNSSEVIIHGNRMYNCKKTKEYICFKTKEKKQMDRIKANIERDK